MEILIFIFYLVCFSYLIWAIPFFKNSQIGKWNLIILFIIKVFAGIAYAKFYTLPKYAEGSDTWRFYRLSLDETKTLLHNPRFFFQDLFRSAYSERGNIFSGENTYWNDLKSNVIIKLMALINVFTNSTYYTNIIFFNFLFLFGLVALFRLFYAMFPGQKLLIISGLFLLPSALFWCSGIHKDGLILSASGLIIYTFYSGLKENFSVKKIFIILFCFLILFALRNYVLFALLPALFSWGLCGRYKTGNLKIFLTVYMSGTALFLLISAIFPASNFLSYVAVKQHEFLLLQGGSKVDIPVLQPTLTSFILFIPHALDMAFIRPHFNEIKNSILIPLFLENLLVLFLYIVAIIYFIKEREQYPILLFLLFFSTSILLLCGYTIPFTGAIVRYKSLILPFIIAPLLCIADNLIHSRKRGKTV